MPSSRRPRSATRPSSRSRVRVSRDPRVESIYVQVQGSPGRDPRTIVRQVLRRARLSGWRVEAAVPDGSEIELQPRTRVQPRTAWETAYALRSQPEVVHAEPMFRYLVPENAESVIRKRSGGGDDDPQTEREYDWSLRKAFVQDAWALFHDRHPGGHVKVGHPDTGYTPHPELAEPSRVLATDGYDFEDDDPDPTDDLAAGTLDNPGHGTGTASVILSGAGPAVPNVGPFVSGVAPHALLIPIRTTESVVLFSMRGLRRAIDHARMAGASVISISLGGPLAGFGTRRAIQRAVDAGIIVVAAAGNHIRFVVYPAAFEETIAVAASNIRDHYWSGSSRGDAVDITAPGESVWRAKTWRAPNGALKFLVERGSGTSYATATLAGVATLWVSYHGASTLTQRYGAPNVSRVFKYLLQATCRRPKNWDTKNYGPGIVDARKLLAAPLPVAPEARKHLDPRRAAVANDATGIETILHLVPDASRTRVETALATVLRMKDRDLPLVLQTFGEELAYHLVMNPAALAALDRASSTGPRALGAGSAALRRMLLAARPSRPLRSHMLRRTP